MRGWAISAKAANCFCVIFSRFKRRAQIWDGIQTWFSARMFEARELLLVNGLNIFFDRSLTDFSDFLPQFADARFDGSLHVTKSICMSFLAESWINCWHVMQ